jgi:hypothetical protein
MSLPPGIVYLAKLLPRLVAPPLLVYGAKVLTELRSGIVIPTWATVLACILSGPAVLTVVVQYNDHKNRRDAAANGAVLPQALPGWIGGINMLFTNVADMYPGGQAHSRDDFALIQAVITGEGLAVIAPERGHTLTMRFLFQNRVSVQVLLHVFCLPSLR